MKRKAEFYYDILNNITEKEKVFKINILEEVIGSEHIEEELNAVDFQMSVVSESLLYVHARSNKTGKNLSGLHSHNVPEILYIKEAQGVFLAEDKRYKLKAGDLIIVPPTVQHRILIDKNTFYDRYDICFDPKFYHDLRFDKIFHGTMVINCSQNKIIRDIFEKTDCYFEELEEEEFTIAIGILLRELVFNVSILKGQTIKPKVLNPILSEAVEYIDKNLYDIKTVSEISDALFISESYLFELFRNKLKTTPTKYLKVKRMHAVRKEIIEGERPTEVFHKAGFSDYTAFYRNYVKFFGYSPSQEKKMKHKKNP